MTHSFSDYRARKTLGQDGFLYGTYIVAAQHVARIYTQRSRCSRTLMDWRSSMMDAIMVGFGVAMFLCFMGYTAVCESL
jgi:hypothetical protein